jgi:hypothetical protein
MICVKMEKKWDRAKAFESLYGENAPPQRISLSNRLKLVLKHPCISSVCIAKSKKGCKSRLFVIESNRKVSVFRFQLFKFFDPDT